MEAYLLDNGRTVWHAANGTGFYGKPTIYKDLILYGNNEGRFFARLWKNGDLHYEIDLGASIEAEPIVYKDRVFVHLRNHRIYCLDVETGKILWAYHRSIPILTTLQRASAPAIFGNSIIVGFADGYLASISVEDGVVLWEQKISDANKFMDIDVSPLIWKDKLIVGSLSSDMLIMNPKSGTIIQRFPYQIHRTPLNLGDRLLVGTTDGRYILLDQFFKILKEDKISKKGVADIVRYRDNFLFLTLAGEMIFLDSKDLKERYRHHTGHAYSAFFADAAVSGDHLAVMSSRFRLYVFNQ
jgi:outer membrane protein assembly factor BamB